MLRWIPAALLDDGCGPAGQVDGPEIVVAAVEDALDQVTLGEVRVTGGGGDVDQVEPSRFVIRGGAVGRFGCEPGELEVLGCQCVRRDDVGDVDDGAGDDVVDPVAVEEPAPSGRPQVT